MDSLEKEEMIIDIEKYLQRAKKEDKLLIAKTLYEKYIEPLKTELRKRENKYSESFCQIQDGYNKMLNLMSKHLNETIKEKEGRINHLEQLIKGLINKNDSLEEKG